MITFYDFDVPVSGGVDVASVLQFDAPATGDFSISDSTFFGGATPEVALILSTGHDPANAGSQTAHMTIGFGSVGSANRSMQTRSTDAATASSCVRSSSTSLVVNVNNAVLGTKQLTGTLAADGVSFTASTAPHAIRCAATMFAGAEISDFAEGVIALGSAVATVTTTIGFEADLVIFFGAGNAMPAGSANQLSFLLGAVVNDGSDTQRSVFWTEQNAVAAGGNPKQAISNAHAIMEMERSTGALLYSGTVGNFTSTSFDVVVNASTSGDGVAYLAFKFATATARIADFDTPTSTGNSAITGVGCSPGWAMLVGTMLESLNSYGATSANQEGMGISFITAADQVAAAFRIVSGADPTVASSRLDDGVSLMVSDNTDSAAIKATLVSLDSDGITQNYSAVKGSAKKGWGVFVG